MENSPIRKKGGFDGKSEHAKKAKKWLMENHARYEERYGLPKGTLVALAGHESHFDPYARSHTGAQGLYQFTEKTAQGYGLKTGGEDDERFDLDKATDAAARYLSGNLKKYNGDIVSSFAQWNGGWKAGDAVKNGTIKDYVSPNGSRELDGFLQGIKNNAKKYGFTDIYNPLASVYGEDIPEENIPVAEEQPVYRNPLHEYTRRKSMTRPLVPTPIAMNKPGSGDYEFMNQIDQQYRLYRSGGSLVQLSGDSEAIEAVMRGNERIYSRKDTKRLMELAKKAKGPDDFFLLGKFLYDATKKQDTLPPEYTDEK